MGLTSSSQSSSIPRITKPSTALPHVGFGAYEVGCADIMVEPDGDGDSGVFMRLFYPSMLKVDLDNPVGFLFKIF